ncbi:MAG: transcription-repair coupling factor [Candidatus Sericytochromatia bacterium]|nr:transcription-repair coupling factor [Candidatus Tanganyikabacteria bacterium]
MSGSVAQLADLVPYLTRDSHLADLLSQRRARIKGPGPQALLLVLAALPPPWLLVLPDAVAARKAAMDLGAFGPDVAYFPACEVSAYHGVSPEPDLVQQRQEVLAGLARGSIDRVVTSAAALAGRVPAPVAWREATLRLRAGDEVPPTRLAQELVKLGLKPAAAVGERGDFSRRGGILDFWPPQAPEPLRVEWFGDCIEAIRAFDPFTQRSLETVLDCEIWPAREIILPAEDWHNAEARIQEALDEQAWRFRGSGHRSEADRLAGIVGEHLSRFKQFQPFEGCEVYAAFFHGLSTLLEHMPAGTRIVRAAGVSGRLADWVKAQAEERKRRRDNGLLLEAPVALVAEPAEVEAALEAFPVLEVEAGEPDGDDLFWWAPPAQAMPNQFGDFARRLAERSRGGERVVVASSQPQRVFALLDEYGCHATFGAQLPLPGGAKYGGVWIFREALDCGFEWPALNLAVYSDHEIFGWQKKAAKVKKIPFAGTPIASVTELRAGDHIVHHKHGIGVYQGLTRLTIDGQEKEYLLVRYLGDDRLYVPVDQVGLLHRYRGGAEVSPKLSKMGGAEWESVKKRVRKSIQQLAEDLIAIYAKRMALPGHAFGPDTDWQRELEDGFPYTETVDQLRAIEETKADLERPRPMDRLICGDVGFGKTEVAIRAAFKAVLGGKQAAILAPTTLLAHQHFQVFRERYAPYPIRVALLSRFRTAGQIRETLKRILLGEVDVVVGTHRLLSKDVVFKDLGLMVVDEEHRFGVGHKERLKAFKSQVDVLSMSATPIPRTLYLALSGARDMSLITTPPSNRLPVKTAVGPWDPEVVRTAILRELERGGQVFFLHNRVEDLEHWAATVKELVPHARVAMAHGQMPENALEDVMLAFVGREFDVLVTTTIIESGLDIPAANTIVIHDADKLGLAQLYQLRGRVGRSDVKAYCFCMFAAGKELTPEARDRLDAISQHTALGSGYQIALRDLEIRGVGNILGPEQHGQMMSVGYDTYMQLLEEAIAAGFGQDIQPREEAVVDLPVAALLPDDWFEDPADKMVQYRRLAQVQTERELELLSEEWRDRFGQFGVPVKNLLRLVAVKLRATDLRIGHVKSETGRVRVGARIARSGWAELQLEVPGLARWQWAEAELSMDRSRLAPEEQLAAVEKLLEALSRQAAAAVAAAAGR